MITVIGNLKGGTGKSTVTFNLAVWLCLKEFEVTVIDLDPQRTLTDVAALRMEVGVEPPIHVQSGPLPDVSRLRESEQTLIDVGTADLEAFKQALTIADRVLIPVTPSQADIWSTQRFVQFLHKTTNGNPPESLTFINRADTSRTIPNTDEAAAALTSLPGVRLIPQRLSDRTMFRDSFSEGLAVFELEPRSRGSAEFKELAAALFSQKPSKVRARPPMETAPAAVQSISGHEPGVSMAGSSAKGIREFDEGRTDAAVDESQDKQGAEGRKKKSRTTEDAKAGKGKKSKGRDKGMKGKHAKKAGKDKKQKKNKKAKKAKKRKK